MTTKTVLTDEEIITIGHQARAIESGENWYILPITFARAIEQAVLRYNAEAIRALLAERDAFREALDQCRFALEPYDDVKPRDWITDRERLRWAHKVAKAALAQEQGGSDGA